jgi:hypothetical protein
LEWIQFRITTRNSNKPSCKFVCRICFQFHHMFNSILTAIYFIVN